MPASKIGAPVGDGEAPKDIEAVADGAGVAVGVRPVVTEGEWDVPMDDDCVIAAVAVGVRPVVTEFVAEGAIVTEFEVE